MLNESSLNVVVHVNIEQMDLLQTHLFEEDNSLTSISTTTQFNNHG